VKQQFVNRHVAPRGHISLISSESAFGFICVLSGEATHTNFIVFGLTRSGSNPQSTTLEASKLTITPPMRLYDQSTIFISSIEFSTEWFEPVTPESDTRCFWVYYRKECFQLITEVVYIK